VTEEWERLKLDYERTVETYWQLADLRFKLLAFVPTISGAAIALLTRASVPRWESSILAGLGFLVTFGIILYDQRNTQFYNRVVGRAAQLEDKLRFAVLGAPEAGGTARADPNGTMPQHPGDVEAAEAVAQQGEETGGRGGHGGVFRSRRSIPRWHFFGLPIKHDLGLALVYSPVLGAWAFAVVRGAWPSHASSAAFVGAIIAVIALIQFEWHDHKPEALWERWEYSDRRASWHRRQQRKEQRKEQQRKEQQRKEQSKAGGM
jgi:hypothetical protein